MITVEEALEKILEAVQPLDVERRPLEAALGHVLAEEIVSELDSPPFDKSLMDGFALRAGDFAKDAALEVVETVTAGMVPQVEIVAGTAARIMTGAPIPVGAEAVIPVERANFDEAASRVTFTVESVERGTNIITRGTNTHVGETVLRPGRRLRPQELGTLAELGRAEVTVHRRPRVSVLATGDELVPVAETPGPGQIRNSNETMLVAQIERAGAEAIPLGIARDDREDLRRKIEGGLDADVLLLSGGVSAGMLDLVPSELAAAGVEQLFHKVRVKPGKPVWFGMRPAAGGRSATCVFGLPGNPVSSMVCAELFARAAIRRLAGLEAARSPVIVGRLEHDHENRGDRPVYHPARIAPSSAGTSVELVRWHGSSDVRATVEANGMALVPAGASIAKGETVDVILWD